MNKCSEKPVSLEVFADEEKDMINQARVINNLGKNVYVKIPIIYTNGKSTLNTIRTLVDENIKLNITAIFLIEQIKDIMSSIRDTKTILSIFAGRIYDSGIDAKENMKEINKLFIKTVNANHCGLVQECLLIILVRLIQIQIS